jgi:tetratricopeptide (TPR) repeat protein
VHPTLRLYLSAQLAVRLGNIEGARQLASRLESERVGVGEGTLPLDLAQGVRGHLAAERGDEAAALAAFDAMPAHSPLERIANSPFFGLTLERWSHAELLRATGNTREALAWYESIGEWRPDIALVTISLLRYGQLREATGDRAAAIEAYRTVVREWRDCEPEMRPLRDEAVQGLRRLGAL